MLCTGIKATFSAVYGEDFFGQFEMRGVDATEGRQRRGCPALADEWHSPSTTRTLCEIASPTTVTGCHGSPPSLVHIGNRKIPLGESVRKRTLVAASRGPPIRALHKGWTVPLHGLAFLVWKQNETAQGPGERRRVSKSVQYLVGSPRRSGFGVNRKAEASARVRLPALFLIVHVRGADS